MTDLEIMQILIKAKELGITQEQVDAYKLVKHETIDEALLKEAFKPMSIMDELSDEEIQYWHSEYYEELQQRKEAQKQRLAENEDLNGKDQPRPDGAN